MLSRARHLLLSHARGSRAHVEPRSVEGLMDSPSDCVAELGRPSGPLKVTLRMQCSAVDLAAKV